MKIPPRSPLNALDFAPKTSTTRAGATGPMSTLDLTPKKPGNPGAAGPIAKLSSDLKAQLAKPVQSHHEQIVAQTQKWVSQTFFGTLLKQMGESPFKSELFSGGRGGEAFQGLYNQQLVDHMAHAAGGKLVRGMVRRIEQKEAADAKNVRSDTKALRMPAKSNDSKPHSDSDPRMKSYLRSRVPSKKSAFSIAA